MLDTSVLSRQELLRLLTDAAVACAEKWGKDERLAGVRGPVRTFASESLSILYTTPETLAPGGFGFGVDVWVHYKKHFSSRWSSMELKDYELISLVRGPWIAQLLNIAAQSEPPALKS